MGFYTFIKRCVPKGSKNPSAEKTGRFLFMMGFIILLAVSVRPELLFVDAKGKSLLWLIAFLLFACASFCLAIWPYPLFPANKKTFPNKTMAFFIGFGILNLMGWLFTN